MSALPLRAFSVPASTSTLVVSTLRTLPLLALVCALAALPAHADSQARIVRLSDVQGPVQIDKNTGMGFENAFLNLPVTQGAQIQTRDRGRAEIEFEDGSTLRLGPNTKVEFSALGLSDAGKRISIVNLVDGSAYANWLGKSGDQFTLNFSREKVELDRPAHFRVEASPAIAKFAVFKGEVQVSGPAGEVTVGKNKMATFDSADDKPTLAKNIEQEPLDSWDKEAIAYHDQYARNNSSNNSSPYGYGLSDLGYYGSYTDVAGYGALWQPYFTGVGWNPFMDGAWSWYPGMGYMFVSAYPWGWMPYRYGSWQFIPSYGWMWQAGNWNSWAAVPRYAGSPALFHPPVAPSGTVSTVIVGKGGPVASPVLSHLVVTRGSAGMGVPRGAVGSLKSLNSQVTKSGLAEVRSTPQFGATSSAHTAGSYAAHPSSTASAGHGSSVGSAHAGGTGHH